MHQIVVVDDSLTVRKILEISLDRAGFTVSSFPDGMQLLQALTQQQLPVPDAVILDVGLPRMDGYALARTLRHHQAFQAVPIILLSGHTGTLDKLRGRLAGATAYVTKPFQPAQVLEVLRAHLVPPLPPAHEQAFPSTHQPRAAGLLEAASVYVGPPQGAQEHLYHRKTPGWR